MKARILLGAALCLALIAALGGAIRAEGLEGGGGDPPIGTAFTYQGRLKKDGKPANGTYDLQFKLFDAASDGKQVESTVTKNDVVVSDGLFTANLDFGDVFDGRALWLEIGVRQGASTGPFTILTPRQELTAAPYSLYSLNADKLDGLHASSFWKTTGNAGTSPPANFLGTTDNVALELKVNNARALRLEPNATSPNIVAGYSGNSVTAGVWGATISGGGKRGWTNRVTDNYGTVGGGGNNQAGNANAVLTDTIYATVGGGEGNVAGGEAATVGGGGHNEATGEAATVGGGGGNTASGPYATVGGGIGSGATGDSATVGGGHENYAEDGYATVSGGVANLASGEASTVGGGWGNEASGSHATVSGGDDNTASARHATVGGGKSNEASVIGSTIGGGRGNVANNENATVGGGVQNTANGSEAAVGGGINNTAGPRATVSGGQANTASGYGATVPGGRSNAAGGYYSFAAGNRAKANNDGCFVWGDSTYADINSSGEDQFIVRANKGIWFGKATTDFTPTIGAGVFISTSTGAYLSTGGVWTNASDRALKDNFTPVDGQKVLARLAEIPITTWSYKAQDSSTLHMGPAAQDFYAAFGLGEDDKHISTVDAEGVALAAIQGLYQLSQEQEAHIQELEAENAALQKRLDDLEARVAALERSAEPAEGTPAASGATPAQPLRTSLLPGASILLAGLALVWHIRGEGGR